MDRNNRDEFFEATAKSHKRHHDDQDPPPPPPDSDQSCQFLGRRLISWQCKKQIIVATSTTEAEYVAAANCCGQVLWIQNQMLDYGFNFMNTKIYIDNESTICIVKNPVFDSKTKHIVIRHHFIRDAYEKKIIQVLKIHTDDNVAYLLTKAFDVSRYITAKVAGKPISISEASIRSDLLFDDADGIDSLPNQAIFDAIQLLKNVPMPLDHFPINALTSKVFSFMVKKGKHFSGNVTPLFDSMLVQPTEDEDQHETQTDPSPRPSPTIHIPDSIPEGSGGNHGGQSSSDRSLLGNEGGMTLQSVYDLCISLCTQSLDEECIHEAKIGGKEILEEIVDAKGVSFDELANDTIDYIETKDAQDVGRTSYVVHEKEESAENEVSTEDSLSTAQPKVSTNKEKVSTDKEKVSTDKPKVSIDKEEVSTERPDEVTTEYDFIQARLNADKILAEKLQKEEREI
ncbi:hypothetical protein Tco_1147045 [Tanacetum coccineum]